MEMKLSAPRGERVVANARYDRAGAAIDHAPIAHLGEQLAATRQAAASFSPRTPQIEDGVEDVSAEARSSDEEPAARFEKPRHMANQHCTLIDGEVIDVVVEHAEVELRLRRSISDVSCFNRRGFSYSALRK